MSNRDREFAESSKRMKEHIMANKEEIKELDNESHPQRPEGTNWKCPVCNIFG